MERIRFDEMTPEEVKAYIDKATTEELTPQLDACSFACLKRIYQKYFGIPPVSTMKRETVQKAFWHRKVELRQRQHYNNIVV